MVSPVLLIMIAISQLSLTVCEPISIVGLQPGSALGVLIVILTEADRDEIRRKGSGSSRGLVLKMSVQDFINDCGQEEPIQSCIDSSSGILLPVTEKRL